MMTLIQKIAAVELCNQMLSKLTSGNEISEEEVRKLESLCFPKQD